MSYYIIVESTNETPATCFRADFPEVAAAKVVELTANGIDPDRITVILADEANTMDAREFLEKWS